MRENMNTELLKAFDQKPVAFNPLLAKIANKATAGLFLCQLLYWHGKGRDKKWVYKSVREVREETGLTRSEQDTAIKIWEQLQVLEVWVRGVPPTRHFSINIDILLSLMDIKYEEDTQLQNSVVQIAENNKLNYGTKQNISESTQRIHTEIPIDNRRESSEKNILPF